MTSGTPQWRRGWPSLCTPHPGASARWGAISARRCPNKSPAGSAPPQSASPAERGVLERSSASRRGAPSGRTASRRPAFIRVEMPWEGSAQSPRRSCAAGRRSCAVGRRGRRGREAEPRGLEAGGGAARPGGGAGASRAQVAGKWTPWSVGGVPRPLVAGPRAASGARSSAPGLGDAWAETGQNGRWGRGWCVGPGNVPQ